MISFFIIPLNVATYFTPYKDLFGLELFIDFVIVADILVNFISETVSDVEVKIYLRDVAL
jgi:hypothetical protein